MKLTDMRPDYIQCSVCGSLIKPEVLGEHEGECYATRREAINDYHREEGEIEAYFDRKAEREEGNL